VALGSTSITVANVHTLPYSVVTNVGQLATLYNPPLGSMLTGSSATFQWNGSNTATAYWIDVGSTQGGNNYYQSGSLPTTTLSQTVNNLPIDGSNLYITLRSEIDGQWAYNEYPYVALNVPAELAVMQTPAPGSTLRGNSVTFNWSAGSGATAYELDAGSAPGGNDVYQSGNLGNIFSVTVNTLPANGNPIYVTLWSMVSEQWFNHEYTYTSGP